MTLPSGIASPRLVRSYIPATTSGEWAMTVPVDAGHSIAVVDKTGAVSGQMAGPLWIKPLLGHGVFRTSSTTGNRYPGNGIWDAHGVCIGQLQSQFPTLHSNSVTEMTYGSGHNWQQTSSAGAVTLTWPNLVMFPGWAFGSATAGLVTAAPADTYDQVDLLLAVWTAVPFLDAYGPMWRAR